MKRRLIPPLLVLSLLSFGQHIRADGMLLEQVSNILASEPLRQGEFEQKKFLTILPHPMLSNGSYSLSENGSLIWRIHYPIESELQFDSSGINQSVNGETTLSLPAETPGISSIGTIIRAVITADWQTLERYFSIEGTTEINHWSLELTPTDNIISANIDRISMKGSSQLETMIMHESSGDRTEFTFSPIANSH